MLGAEGLGSQVPVQLNRVSPPGPVCEDMGGGAGGGEGRARRCLHKNLHLKWWDLTWGHLDVSTQAVCVLFTLQTLHGLHEDLGIKSSVWRDSGGSEMLLRRRLQCVKTQLPGAESCSLERRRDFAEQRAGTGGAAGHC